MRVSQVEKLDLPSKLSKWTKALRKESCSASSASSRFLVMRNNVQDPLRVEFAKRSERCLLSSLGSYNEARLTSCLRGPYVDAPGARRTTSNCRHNLTRVCESDSLARARNMHQASSAEGTAISRNHLNMGYRWRRIVLEMRWAGNRQATT